METTQRQPVKAISQALHSLLFNYGGQIALKLLGLFISVFIIRKLSVLDYGVYNQFLYTLPIFSVLGVLGTPFLLRRFIPECFSKGDYTTIRRLIWGSTGVTLILSFLLLIVAILLRIPLSVLLKSPSIALYLPLFGIGMLFATLVNVLDTAATSLLLQSISNAANIVSTIVQAALYFVVLITGQGIKGLVFAFVIANLVWAVFLALALLLYLRNKHDTVSQHFHLNLQRIWRFTGISYLNEAINLIFSSVSDVYILSYFTNPETVGLYTFALTTIKLLTQWAPTVAGRNVIEPLFYQRYAKSNNMNDLDHLFKRVLNIVMLFSIPTFLGVLVLGDKIINFVFDAKYINAFPVLIVLMFFDVFNSFSWPLGLVVYSTEHVEIQLYSRIFVIYNLLTSIWWVHGLGMMGIALSTGSAVLLKALSQFFLIRKYVRISIDWATVFKLISCSSLMAALVFATKGMVNNIWSLVVVILIGVAIYGALIYFSRVLEGEIKSIFLAIRSYLKPSIPSARL